MHRIGSTSFTVLNQADTAILSPATVYCWLMLATLASRNYTPHGHVVSYSSTRFVHDQHHPEKRNLGVCCHRNGMFLRCCDRHTALQSSAERRSATAHHFAQAPHAAWEVLPRIATANVLWLNILLVLLPAYRQVA